MLSRRQFHQTFYLVATMALAASLPLSHFMMGLSCFLIFLNWLCEWNWREKMERMRENMAFLPFSAFYIVFAIGLARTTDWQAAGSEMLSKITFLLAPIIIVTSKRLEKKELGAVFTVFIAATLAGCLWNTAYALSHSLSDHREMSRFIDHIRFALCVVMSVVFCIHYSFCNFKTGKVSTAFYLTAAATLSAYLIFSQTLSGIATLFVLALAFAVHLYFTSKNRKLKAVVMTTATMLLVVATAYTSFISYEYFHSKEAAPDRGALTCNGRAYRFVDDPIIENGHYIGYYVCDEELERAWKMRSDTVYSEIVSATLVRYLNSLGMRKDSAAVMSLTDTDIKNVENRYANVEYSRVFSAKKALYQTFFAISLYRKHNVYDESSLLQRVELWKATWSLIKENPVLGVGIGNQRAALDKRLEDMGSPIAGKKKGRGSHNQFLTFWLTSGVFALAYFVFILVYPFLFMKNRIGFVYIALILAIFLSMFVEDTLNAQTGRMLYTIFAPLLLFSEIEKP